MRIGISALALLSLAFVANAAETEDLLRAARTALKRGDLDAAMKSAEEAVKQDAKNPLCYFIRGDVYGAQRKSEVAIKDYDKAIELDKTFLIAVNRRGGEQFKLGKIKESIEDFNTFLKANPKEEPAHWQRGISFYYAAQYDEGAKQFVDGQIAYGTDVENAFWHYLCVSRKEGVEKARKGILPIKEQGGKFPDTRVPMKEIYDLIQGKVKPEQVIEAAEKAKLDDEDKNEARFYANLYVALNYEAEGNAVKTKEHLTTAEKHKISHYMWDVAHVHLKLMKK